MKSLRVLSIASEIYPLIRIGELADVTGALAIALRSEGIEVCTLIPGYPAVLNSLGPVEGVIHLPDFFGAAARLLRATSFELGLFVLDAPHLLRVSAVLICGLTAWIGRTMDCASRHWRE